MEKEIAVENGRILDFHRLVTLTLTLDRVTLHTVVHHSSTSTHVPNFIEIEETFCGLTDGRTDGHLRPTLLGRLGGVDLKSNKNVYLKQYFLCLLVKVPLVSQNVQKVTRFSNFFSHRSNKIFQMSMSNVTTVKHKREA